VITTIWKDILDMDCDPETDGKNHHIYVIKDGEGGVLYVGRSKDACDRLLDHVGMDKYSPRYLMPSSIGRFILDHRPRSLYWKIDLYTLEECQTICSENAKEHGWVFQLDASNIVGQELIISEAESVMIMKLAPPFNVIGNPNRRRMYRVQPGIANEGVILASTPDVNSEMEAE